MMRLATTIGDFRRFTKTPAEAVRAFEGTGFRYLDYSFYSVIYPGSPFLTGDWFREVDEAAEEAARLSLRQAWDQEPRCALRYVGSDALPEGSGRFFSCEPRVL